MTLLETYKKRLELYIQAEEAILSGAQHYQIGTRSLTRADLHEIRMMIDKLIENVKQEEAVEKGKSRMKTVGVIPRDW